MPPQAYRSAFVPHDLKAPVEGAAAGPLAGLSAVVKDMYDIAGERMGCGNPDWLASHAPATRHCPPVQKILDAGATIIGKTVCDEFFYSVTGANAHYGTPVNVRAHGAACRAAHRPARLPRSAPACAISRSAATPAARCASQPRSTASTACVRPTNASSTAAWRTWRRASTCRAGLPRRRACSATSARCCSTSRRVPAKINRVVVLEDAFAQADPEIADLLHTLLEFMSDDLPAMAHGKIAPDGFDPWREAFRIIQAYETWQSFGGFVVKHRPKIGPGIRERMEFAATVTKAQADAARLVHGKAREHIRQIAAPGTVLALPTVADDRAAGRHAGRRSRGFPRASMRLTCTAGIAGLPQMNIPAGTLNGCPIGLSFIGWAGGDEALLDLACALSRHCGMAA